MDEGLRCVEISLLYIRQSSFESCALRLQFVDDAVKPKSSQATSCDVGNNVFTTLICIPENVNITSTPHAVTNVEQSVYTKPMSSQTQCRFLSLPVELRLVIYQHALHEEVDVTIGCEQYEVTYTHTSDQVDASHLPKYRPIIKGGYHAALLSPTATNITPHAIHEASQHASNANLPTTAHSALLATCRTTRTELRDNLPKPAQRRTNLFIQYPDGLKFLNTAFPHLAQHARSLNITGVYRPEGYYDPDVRANLPPTDPLATALYTMPPSHPQG
jgi:hypothetical protein